MSIIIDRLKIIDCADDDEDMNVSISIYAHGSGGERRVFSKTYSDAYVEEEGKIGNDSKCTFFAGERVDRLADVDRVQVAAVLSTLDGDGFDWGGDHVHTKDISGLRAGSNSFVETKEHSSNPNTQGVYELRYTIVKH
ncbi:hypothetical protein WMF30_31160 [Sorangium sp. So ce134]